uniref:Uncharacterized protein n=1 Tax=Globodera pallida TaxID=36090 RepID=A0A183BI50_GLOPA
MKLFAMLMLRFEIVMLLYSLFQSVTLVTLHEVHKCEEWKKSCQEVINEISTAQVPISLDDLSGIRQIKTTFHNMSIAKEFEKEFNTFIFEVELELTKQATWTLGINHELGNKFNALWTSTEKKECYCDIDSFKKAWSSTNGNYEHLEPLIIDAKLSSLEKELHAKIVVFAQQPQPFFDWDGFFGFSTNFCFKWNDIKKNIEDLENLDEKNEVYRKKLDDLAKNALNETVPLKAIITQKLDKVSTNLRPKIGNERLMDVTEG